MQKYWETYEQVATHILGQIAKQFELNRVEPKQVIQGQSTGTEWEIDAKGIKEGEEGFVIVECRRYTTSKQTQEKLAGLAFKIADTGATGGIIVSPLGLQEGATKIAASENIINVTLDANSTTTDYILKFLNRVMVGISVSEGLVLGDTPSIEVTRKCKKCGKQFEAVNNERICSDCALRAIQ